MAWLTLCALMFMGRTGELFIVIPMFVAYYSAFTGTWSNRFFCQPIIYIIGGMCYTLYLYHYVVISSFKSPLHIIKVGFMDSLPLWVVIILATLVMIPLILLFCSCLFVLIEKPCMKKNWHLQLLERIRL
jgi:peptidoglycan/LPS O-acetylase OafA/YrhL